MQRPVGMRETNTNKLTIEAGRKNIGSGRDRPIQMQGVYDAAK